LKEIIDYIPEMRKKLMPSILAETRLNYQLAAALNKQRSDDAFGKGMLKTGFASIIKDIPARAAQMAALRAEVDTARLKEAKRDLRPQRVAQNYFTGAPIGTYKARGF
jgi:hypothetical protein